MSDAKYGCTRYNTITCALRVQPCYVQILGPVVPGLLHLQGVSIKSMNSNMEHTQVLGLLSLELNPSVLPCPISTSFDAFMQYNTNKMYLIIANFHAFMQYNTNKMYLIIENFHAFM